MHKNLPLYFIKMFFGCLVILLGSITLTNYLCDPIQLLRRSTGKLLISNQRLQVAGFVRTFDYDLVVIGNSMVETTSPNLIKKWIPSNPILLAMAGSSTNEQVIPLQKALETGKVKTVVWALAQNTLSYKDAMLPSTFPLYLYEDSWRNNLKYLFNYRIFEFSIKHLFKAKGLSDAELLENYRQDKNHFTPSKEVILKHYYKNQPKHPPQCPTTIDYTEAQVREKNFIQDILSLVKQYPQVKFCFFLPPYSLAAYKLAYYNCNEFKNTVRMREKLFEALVHLPNVEIYDFETDLSIIRDLDNYNPDLMHYSQSIKDKIVIKIANKENLVTAVNIQDKNLAFQQQVLLPLE